MRWRLILFLLHYFLALYPRGSFVLGCTAALDVYHLYLLAFNLLHLDSCLSHLLTMSSVKSTLQSLSLGNLTHLFTCGKNFPLSVIDQFCHLALSIGMFPSQELMHPYRDTRSFHYTIAFFYSFSGFMNMK